jgi:hypothetical protein
LIEIKEHRVAKHELEQLKRNQFMLNLTILVTLARAGVELQIMRHLFSWIPAFAGMTKLKVDRSKLIAAQHGPEIRLT